MDVLDPERTRREEYVMNWQNAAKIIAGGALGIGCGAMITYLSEYGFAGTGQAAGETTTPHAVTTAMPQTPAAAAASSSDEWHVPNVDKLSDDAWGKTVGWGVT
jgi:hypothetical protein